MDLTLTQIMILNQLIKTATDQAFRGSSGTVKHMGIEVSWNNIKKFTIIKTKGGVEVTNVKKG